MEHTKHLWRAGLVLLVLLVVGVLVRHFLVPESFGKTGYYRYESLQEFMDQPIVHGSPTSCKVCHQEEFEERNEGRHASVPCETCHGPLTAHVNEGEKIADMPTNPSYRLCTNCHLELPSRPETMPQIVVSDHLIEQMVLEPDQQIPEQACLGLCHTAHSPATE